MLNFVAKSKGVCTVVAQIGNRSYGAFGNYSRFHNLNTLAAEICAFEGEAKIIKDK